MVNDDLLTRAVSKVVPRNLAEEKLKSGKPLRMYWGIDPTGSKMHLGHSLYLLKFRQFMEAGHEVIFLIGSFTAMIGDPSGRDSTRVQLTKEQVEENFKTYKREAGKILDFTKVKTVYNHEWLGKLTFADIAKLASNFTVQQMLARDLFQERIGKENPIALHEFLYPLMVGYDSVMLDVDCEMGGNDQLFNMLCGRTLQQVFSKRDKFVIALKLLEGTDGRKMSKTYDNCIYLTDAPADMYGKVMSVKDSLVETYFECCTEVPMNEVRKILRGNPRDCKARLALEITSLYHGREAAATAGEEFSRVFGKERGLPDRIPEATAGEGTLLIDILVREKLAASKSEARRLIAQGGITLNGRSITSLSAGAEEGTLKVGKRKFLRLKIIP